MSKPASCCCFVSLLGLLWSDGAPAVTYHVPADVSSMGAALGLAGSGDSVLVSPGTYFCSAAVHPGVVLVGLGGPGGVILDAQAQGSVLMLADAGNSTVLRNLTLRGGIGTSVDNTRQGGGIYSLRSSPLLAGVRITGCGATVGGGAYFEQGSPTLLGCRMDHDQGDFGGGLALNHSIASLDTCSLLANASTQSGGAVLAINGASAAIYLGVIGENSAGGPGGGVYFLNSAGNLLQVVVRGNVSSLDGGGIYCGQGSTVDFTGDVFWKNSGVRGGGLYLGCAEAPGRPRGIGPRAQGRAANPCTLIQLVNNTLMENSASLAGGGIAANDAAQVRILNNIIALSGAGYGVSCLDLRTTLDVRCNDVWRNLPADWDVGCSAPDHPEFNNISVNPLFCHPEAGDFGLCANTPVGGLRECFTSALGAFDIACPSCATPVRPMTWGRLRRVYGEESPAGPGARRASSSR